LAVVALAAAASGVFVWRPWSRGVSAKAAEPVVAAMASSAAAVPSSSAAAPASTLTELTVRATPSGATIFVDGIEVAENPFVGRFVRDGASHRVRAEASGFASKSVRVEFASETASLELVLERQSGAPRRNKAERGDRSAPQTAAVAQPVAPSQVPGSAPAPSSAKPPGADDPWSKRKKPTFDSSDPWK
jgi:hypothetical protein